MLKNSDFKQGVVALSTCGRIALVKEIRQSNKKYPIIYTFDFDKRGYKGNAENFLCILGQVNYTEALEAWNDHRGLGGDVKATPRGVDNDFLMPEKLRGLKIGDEITIRSRRGTDKVIFEGYNPKAPKNCVEFTMNGKPYKGPLGIVVRDVPKAEEKTDKPHPKEAEIMRKINETYAALEPERLSCDGELSKAQTLMRRVDMEKQLKDLFTHLGREVSEEEAWEYVKKSKTA